MAHHSNRRRAFVCITGQLSRLELDGKIRTVLQPLREAAYDVDVGLVLSSSGKSYFTNAAESRAESPFRTLESAEAALNEQGFPNVSVEGIVQSKHPWINPTYLEQCGGKWYHSRLKTGQTSPEKRLAKAANQARQFEAVAACNGVMSRFGGASKYDLVVRFREDTIHAAPLDIPYLTNIVQLTLNNPETYYKFTYERLGYQVTATERLVNLRIKFAVNKATAKLEGCTRANVFCELELASTMQPCGPDNGHSYLQDDKSPSLVIFEQQTTATQKATGWAYVCITGQLSRLELKSKVDKLIRPLAARFDNVHVTLAMTSGGARFTNAEDRVPAQMNQTDGGEDDQIQLGMPFSFASAEDELVAAGATLVSVHEPFHDNGVAINLQFLDQLDKKDRGLAFRFHRAENHIRQFEALNDGMNDNFAVVHPKAAADYFLAPLRDYFQPLAPCVDVVGAVENSMFGGIPGGLEASLGRFSSSHGGVAAGVSSPKTTKSFRRAAASAASLKGGGQSSSYAASAATAAAFPAAAAAAGGGAWHSRKLVGVARGTTGKPTGGRPGKGASGLAQRRLSYFDALADGRLDEAAAEVLRSLPIALATSHSTPALLGSPPPSPPQMMQHHPSQQHPQHLPQHPQHHMDHGMNHEQYHHHHHHHHHHHLHQGGDGGSGRRLPDIGPAATGPVVAASFLALIRDDDARHAAQLAKARAGLTTREAVRRGESHATHAAESLRHMAASTAWEQQQLTRDIKDGIRASRKTLPLDFIFDRALRHYRRAKLRWGADRWRGFLRDCRANDERRRRFAPQVVTIQRAVRGYLGRLRAARLKFEAHRRRLLAETYAAICLQCWVRRVWLRRRLVQRARMAHARAVARERDRYVTAMQAAHRGGSCRARMRGRVLHRLTHQMKAALAFK
eukprot:g4213.t1